MMNARPTRSILATAVSRLLPVLAAAAITFGGLSAYAVTPEEALATQLAKFAAEKSLPAPAKPVATPTVVTAKPDDLVYAIFQLTLSSDFNDPSEVVALVNAALAPVNGKARADKDKIAARVLNAALSGSGITNPVDVATITSAIVNVNTGTGKTALTIGGKAAVIGQALKVSPTGAGDDLAALASAIGATGAGATPDLKRQTFAISVLKAANGSPDAEVKLFTDRLLDDVTNTADARNTFALNVAKGLLAVPKGVVPNPVIAGDVIGGRAADIASVLADSAATRNANILTLANKAITDAKLVKAIAPIAFSTSTSIDTADKSLNRYTIDLVTGLGTKATSANRGAVEAGIVQNPAIVTQADVDAVVVAALTNKTFTKADVLQFAGTAATGTGDKAALVVTKLSGLSTAVGGTKTDLTSVGKAILKSIATTSPSSGDNVASALIAASPAVFDQSTLVQLAKDLSKAVPTNYSLIGYATAGVASQLTAANNPAALATFGATIIQVNTKAALNIAQQLAAVAPAGTSVPTVTDFKQFAITFVQQTGITTATAPGVAAGIAVTATQGKPHVNGQSAGDIAAAVAQASEALKPKAAIIASAVATAVDVERVADVGGKIAALLQNTGSTSKLPKLTTIGALATALTKIIETKPSVATVRQGIEPALAGRVDEIGELAAELTRSAIAALGPNATPTQLQSTIGSIGTGVIKGLSAALLMNGANFAADQKDALRDIAGSIAQTIQVVIGTANGQTGIDLANALTSPTGPLALALQKATKSFKSAVSDAFGEVSTAANTSGNTSRLVTGNEPLGVGEVATGQTGKYEIGSFLDPETPFKNL